MSEGLPSRVGPKGENRGSKFDDVIDASFGSNFGVDLRGGNGAAERAQKRTIMPEVF